MGEKGKGMERVKGFKLEGDLIKDLSSRATLKSTLWLQSENGWLQSLQVGDKEIH